MIRVKELKVNNDVIAELVTAQEYPAPQIDDSGYRKFGFIVLFVLVGIFGAWASFAPLESGIPASGKVIVVSSNRTIQHLEGGVIESLMVQDGQMVKKGDVLATIDPAQVVAQLKVVEASYYYALALESRLSAEHYNKNEISFSSEFNIQPGKNYRLAVENQLSEFRVRRSAVNSEVEMLDHKIDQVNQQIIGLKATKKSKEDLIATYKDETKELEVLYKQQLIDKMRLREANRQVYTMQSDIINAGTEIARMQAEIQELNEKKSNLTVTFQKDVSAEISHVQAQLSDSRARMTGLSEMLARTKIIAPVDGIVSNLAIHTLGGVVPPGRPIMDIVPNGEDLIIEARITAQDITSIHDGLRASVQFPSFAHVKTLKDVEGEVTFIGADAIEDDKHELHYPVKIRITQAGMQELRKNSLILQPGMPAAVMIVIAKRTFADYLIHPFKQLVRKSFNEQ